MTKIVRSQQPKKYKDYTAYKPALREDFDYTCVYCNVYESELGGKKSFHIDHYRPISKPHFKHLETEYKNLLYSCRDCNEFKGDYWPNAFQRLLGEYILDPCEFDIDEHIDKTNHEWHGVTKTGIFNIDELHLSDENHVLRRVDRERWQELMQQTKQLYDAAQRTLQLSLIQCDTISEAMARTEIIKWGGQLNMLQRKLTKKLD